MKKFTHILWMRLLVITVLFGLITSCEIGSDGYDGRSYLALSYTLDEPDYIDAGTSSVPAIFYWNEYYRVQAGFYTFYYDGYYSEGFRVLDYAWEVDYEIYYLEGESGAYGYNGEDAPDAYFTIECNPFGPYVYEDYYKTAEIRDASVSEADAEKIVLLKEANRMGIKITYRKVDKRN